jgi:hypothetical protein
VGNVVEFSRMKEILIVQYVELVDQLFPMLCLEVMKKMIFAMTFILGSFRRLCMCLKAISI